MKFRKLLFGHRKHLFCAFLLFFMFVAIDFLAALGYEDSPQCAGFFKGSDDTITQVYVWADLDSLNPTLKKSYVKKAFIDAQVLTVARTTGRGRVGVYADGEVKGGVLTGETESTGDLGEIWDSDAVGGFFDVPSLLEGMLGYDITKKETDGQWYVDQALTYTLSGRGQTLAVSGGVATGFSLTRDNMTVTLTYTLTPLTSPTMKVTADDVTLTVTRDREDPKSYECSHDECSVMLPHKHHHRVICQEDRWHSSTRRRVTCRREYYRCQTTTCPLDRMHAATHACGVHEDYKYKVKMQAAFHALQASCTYSTVRNGETVYCTRSNFYACDPCTVHILPPEPSNSGSGSNPGSTVTVPDRPASFSVYRAASRGSMILSWSVSETGDGGLPIEDFEYQYQRQTGSNSWTSWSDWESAGKSGYKLITGLVSKGRYGVRMRAKNEEGYSIVTGIDMVTTN